MNSRKDVFTTYFNETVICHHLFKKTQKIVFGLLSKKEGVVGNCKSFKTREKHSQKHFKLNDYGLV